LNYYIKNNFTTATFNSKGAELISLKTNENEYIWDGNAKFWGKHSPVLFPIVGTLKNNTYIYDSKNYTLPRHGFARDMEFEAIESKESITFSLKSHSITQKMYPFDFELQIKYLLVEKTLTIQYLVFNKSEFEMPFSIGAHPAFSLKKGFEYYSLEFSNDDILTYNLLENGLIMDKKEEIILDKNKLDLIYKTFENDALVLKSLKSSSITILENSVPYLKIQFNDFPNLGIWTIKNAKFICIEPWFGYSDTINSTGNLFDKEGIIILERNKQFLTEFSIEIV
jgi:galactose mutarotase-like enzyme